MEEDPLISSFMCLLISLSLCHLDLRKGLLDASRLAGETQRDRENTQEITQCDILLPCLIISITSGWLNTTHRLKGKGVSAGCEFQEAGITRSHLQSSTITLDTGFSLLEAKWSINKRNWWWNYFLLASFLNSERREATDPGRGGDSFFCIKTNFALPCCHQQPLILGYINTTKSFLLFTYRPDISNALTWWFFLRKKEPVPDEKRLQNFKDLSSELFWSTFSYGS